jgi:hypothetical protein
VLAAPALSPLKFVPGIALKTALISCTGPMAYLTFRWANADYVPAPA